MKVLTWNLNSRTSDDVVNEQLSFILAQNADVICLQEVVKNSCGSLQAALKHADYCVTNSFSLAPDLNVLTGKRKYGEIIATKRLHEALPLIRELPYPERVLSVQMDDYLITATHVPPGSSNGLVKVEHLEILYAYLLKHKESNKIVCGDFNAPQKFLPSQVLTWGQRERNNKVVMQLNPKWKEICTPERWDQAERQIFDKVEELNLQLSCQDNEEYSWSFNRQGNIIKRRYDHIFIPKNHKVADCQYYHHIKKLSDHSPHSVVTELS